MPKNVESVTDIFDLRKAVREYHFPSSRRAFILARERLAFNELFLMQLKQLKNRGVNEHKIGKIQSPDLHSVANFFQQLDFELTSAQKKAWPQIAGDMESFAIMQRLLQGDLGSGKTVVAALALLTAVNNDNMGLVMAPTEILAEQHIISLQEYNADLELNLKLFTGSLCPGEGTGCNSMVAEEDHDDIYEFLRSRLSLGKKAYIVCPFRETSQKLPDLVSAAERKEVLEDEKLSDLAVELLHGGMKYEEKRNIMHKIRRDEIDVLVTTSVIEVGIDIEKATFISG